MATPAYSITVTHRCGHQTTRPICAGTEQTIRQASAVVACQECRVNQPEPIRFASGWKYKRPKAGNVPLVARLMA